MDIGFPGADLNLRFLRPLFTGENKARHSGAHAHLLRGRTRNPGVFIATGHREASDDEHLGIIGMAEVRVRLALRDAGMTSLCQFA